MRWEGGKDMHTHMRTQHNIQHSAFSIQHSAQEGFIIIQHPVFSIQRRRHSSSFSIQHSAQEGCTIQRRRLHHSAMKIACVGNTTPAPPPRTTKENVCVGNTTQEGFIIIQHSAQEAFSAGPGVLGTHTEQLYQRVARDVRDVHAVVLDSTAHPRLLDLQLRQPSLRVMRPWPCGPV
jgi:hypothetical protein